MHEPVDMVEGDILKREYTLIVVHAGHVTSYGYTSVTPVGNEDFSLCF